MSWKRLALTLAAVGLACVSRSSNDDHERAPSAPAHEDNPRIDCALSPPTTRLIAPKRGECPIVLTLIPAPAPGEANAEPIGAWVALSQLPRKTDSTTAPLAIGPAPLACGPELAGCELFGVSTREHGPIVIASERGPESEHPVQVHFGIHEDGRLAFIPSWYGEHSVVDHTRVGPPFALAPFDCKGELRMLPAPRLPEAEGELVPGTLMMLAGRWWIGERGQVVGPQIPEPDAGGCTLLVDPLP